MALDPPHGQSILVRTDFSDDDAWHALVRDAQAIHRHPGGYDMQAVLTPVDDRRFENRTIEELLVLDVDSHYLFVADSMTIQNPQHPILVLDMVDDEESDDEDDEDVDDEDMAERVRSFRVTPESLPSVENNLSIANLDFADFADHLDSDGVYRG
ncbi:hypothetical protein CH251_06235 [Rhodococcus sp. 06-462-5]|uniref:DUF6924 domain-containing protein n=1 Tax=unclassified Rhodococcus (in: high G+C Gram-positive bacteria) TaxID=192944 RepID=UPI000B9AC3A0|nr:MULTISPECIES: hypothetical protein [unclassified Rhodococcus (in: high G+C Gram-positive bacteria)]OZC76493.1 hypothetical protein CH251_06235 [Rhodococcus sp. 06-462-5]OZE64550.1 hypothetical protein CH270_15975 [Rhodococcus sp. 02-925g]